MYSLPTGGKMSAINCGAHRRSFDEQGTAFCPFFLDLLRRAI